MVPSFERFRVMNDSLIPLRMAVPSLPLRSLVRRCFVCGTGTSAPTMSLFWSAAMTMVLGSLLSGQSAPAQDIIQTVSATTSAGRLKASFRVETEIFEGTQSQPQSQHLSLFDSGLIYDLPIGGGSTITMFDPIRDRVVLLHKLQKVRTSITNDSLIRVAAQLRAAAVESGAEKRLGLSARVLQGESSGSYLVEFGDTKYVATTQTALVDSMAQQYAEFTVWASRLNLARQIGSPPFARIALAEQMASEGLVPRQVKLEVRRGLKTRTFRSEHLYVGRLSDADRQKISDIGSMMASFEEVEFSAFPVD